MMDEIHGRPLLYRHIQSVLAWLLQHGLDICQSSFGNVQLMSWQSGYLEIKAQHGFNDEFLNFFARVGLADASACARALRRREPIIIEDVMSDDRFAPCRAIVSRAGIRGRSIDPSAVKKRSATRHRIDAFPKLPQAGRSADARDNDGSTIRCRCDHSASRQHRESGPLKKFSESLYGVLGGHRACRQIT
jgi:hypothetical protein